MLYQSQLKKISFEPGFDLDDALEMARLMANRTDALAHLDSGGGRIMKKTITIDGKIIPFEEGQTIMEAATAAGVYIPHLCHHPDYTPHGSCKLCTVKVNGRICSACTFPAIEGQEVLSNTKELNDDRQKITQMLFVEGNHFCPVLRKNRQLSIAGSCLSFEYARQPFPAFLSQPGSGCVSS